MMTLENLLRIGKLKPHAADHAEIGRLLAAAKRALADAGIERLSSDARLDLAYRAIMQAGGSLDSGNTTELYKAMFLVNRKNAEVDADVAKEIGKNNNLLVGVAEAMAKAFVEGS